MKKIIYGLYILISLQFIPDLLSQTVTPEYLAKKYTETVDRIIRAAMSDSSAWERLAYVCDTFGPRLSGSQNLENALKWAREEMNRDGLQNVKAEDVLITHWVRGRESCEMVSPRKQAIPILGFGGTVPTPKEGITAPVIVFRTFAELEKRRNEIPGKIVVYNQDFINYGQAVEYRWSGAVAAARYGAVATLCRAVSSNSMHNPHTGSMGYSDTVRKIPNASIPAEDAQMLERMERRGQKPVVHIYIESDSLPDSPSFNVMGDLTGSEKPNEILAIGGHSDSWDVGLGAHDDAGGFIATWQAVLLLQKLGIKPKRTIRTVLWVNEENGVKGGRAYAEKHKDEKHVLMFEFDSGVFPPSEIKFTGNDSLLNFVKYFEPFLKKIDNIKVTDHGGGVDISHMSRLGVPSMSLNTEDNQKYFWYHHSYTDTPDKIDPAELNRCVAAIAVAVYLYSELPVELPSQFDSHNSISK